MPEDGPSPERAESPEPGSPAPEAAGGEGEAPACGAEARRPRRRPAARDARDSRLPKWDLIDAAAIVCYETGAVGAGAWIGGLVAGAAGPTAAKLVYAFVWCAMVLPVVPFIARRWWGAAPCELGIARPREGSLKWFLRFALAAGVGYLVLAGALVACVRPGLVEFAVSEPGAARAIGAHGGVFTMLLIFLVAAPLTEELAFRGVLYPALREKLGVGWAVLVSAMIFAAVHPLQRWALFVPVTQFLGGLIFAWSYEKTRSLVYPVVFHAIGNAGVAGWMFLSAYRPEWISSLLDCPIMR